MFYTSKIREKVQFLSITLCPLSFEHSVTLPTVWRLCNEAPIVVQAEQCRMAVGTLLDKS